MNWDNIQGNWKELKGKLRSKWGKLTDDDLEHIAGKKDALLGRLQLHYGFAKDEAERQLDSFINEVPTRTKGH
ncbi:MAG TPA: CsbD family protein [Polyangiaceae bacterium]